MADALYVYLQSAQRKLMLQILTTFISIVIFKFTVSADLEADLWLGGVSGFAGDCAIQISHCVTLATRMYFSS